MSCVHVCVLFSKWMVQLNRRTLKNLNPIKLYDFIFFEFPVPFSTFIVRSLSPRSRFKMCLVLLMARCSRYSLFVAVICYSSSPLNGFEYLNISYVLSISSFTFSLVFHCSDNATLQIIYFYSFFFYSLFSPFRSSYFPLIFISHISIHTLSLLLRVYVFIRTMFDCCFWLISMS